MNLIFLILIIILTISCIYFTKSTRKKNTYLRAGKKWDGIVKELRNRR